MNQSSNNSLKQAVRHHIDEVNLSEDQLNRLNALMDTSDESDTRNKLWFGWLSISAVAAFFLVFIVSTWFIEQPTNMVQRIAEEVVHNHLKLKPLEVKTDSIDGVRQYFSKLDFMPIDSVLVNDPGLSLIGGRYCSLQGLTAAQLRLKKDTNKTIQTFYQTEYRKDIFGDLPHIAQGDKPVETYVKGIKVKIWVEKGLIFALTEAP